MEHRIKFRSTVTNYVDSSEILKLIEKVYTSLDVLRDIHPTRISLMNHERLVKDIARGNPIPPIDIGFTNNNPIPNIKLATLTNIVNPDRIVVLDGVRRLIALNEVEKDILNVPITILWSQNINNLFYQRIARNLNTPSYRTLRNLLKALVKLIPDYSYTYSKEDVITLLAIWATGKDSVDEYEVSYIFACHDFLEVIESPLFFDGFRHLFTSSFISKELEEQKRLITELSIKTWGRPGEKARPKPTTLPQFQELLNQTLC